MLLKCWLLQAQHAWLLSTSTRARWRREPRCRNASVNWIEAVSTKLASPRSSASFAHQTRYHDWIGNLIHLCHPMSPGEAFKSSTSMVSPIDTSLGIITPLELLASYKFSGSSSWTSVSDGRLILKLFMPSWLGSSSDSNLTLFVSRCPGLSTAAGADLGEEILLHCCSKLFRLSSPWALQPLVLHLHLQQCLVLASSELSCPRISSFCLHRLPQLLP